MATRYRLPAESRIPSVPIQVLEPGQALSVELPVGLSQLQEALGLPTWPLAHSPAQAGERASRGRLEESGFGLLISDEDFRITFGLQASDFEDRRSKPARRLPLQPI